MILETYHVRISLLHILFCKISLYIFCPYSIWTCLIYVCFSLENSLHILDMVPIVTVVVCKYFLSLDILSFNPLNRVFHRVKPWFDEVLLVNYFIYCASGVMFKNSSPSPRSSSFSTILTFKDLLLCILYLNL